VLSGGGGGLYRYDVPRATLTPLDGMTARDAHWDNHMLKGEVPAHAWAKPRAAG
jgi:hypothetical protein